MSKLFNLSNLYEISANLSVHNLAYKLLSPTSKKVVYQQTGSHTSYGSNLLISTGLIIRLGTALPCELSRMNSRLVDPQRVQTAAQQQSPRIGAPFDEHMQVPPFDILLEWHL